MIRIAINGFGRIGRTAAKIALTKPGLKLAAINDLADNQTLAQLFKFDSNYGTFKGSVSATDDYLNVDRQKIWALSEKDPTLLPWEKLKIDVVLECTGIFTSQDTAKAHLQAGAKRVIISAPPKDDTPTFILGVNDQAAGEKEIISNASCTTNCVAPIIEVINRKIGIRKAAMTTAHSYTADQNLHDGPHRDLRRARAAAENIVPTTTGAAISTTEVVPELKGKFDGLAIRVPTPVVSLSDLTILSSRATTAEEVNQCLIDASNQSRYRGIIAVTNDPLVSTDLKAHPASAIVDLSLTKVIDHDLVKIIAWYDNEYGYSARLVEMAVVVGQR